MPDVAHEIRNQYTIAYSSTNPALDGTFRKINVIRERSGPAHGAQPQRLLCDGFQ